LKVSFVRAISTFTWILWKNSTTALSLDFFTILHKYLDALEACWDFDDIGHKIMFYGSKALLLSMENVELEPEQLATNSLNLMSELRQKTKFLQTNVGVGFLCAMEVFFRHKMDKRVQIAYNMLQTFQTTGAFQFYLETLIVQKMKTETAISISHYYQMEVILSHIQFV